jgi:hypothetical protein
MHSGFSVGLLILETFHFLKEAKFGEMGILLQLPELEMCLL